MEINLHRETVTVVIPCRNEEDFIGGVLENILDQDYPEKFLEVLVVDGESEDKTRAIIKQFAAAHQHIRCLNNPLKIVPHALNQAIRQASGSIIVRMDAHSIYPKDYISSLVSGLSQFKCDNTGGVWITEPANDSLKAMAIADATSHPFGIGNAHYRLDIKSPKIVDTVPYGCYRKEVFDRIGLFDEELVRNQDDEFNARLIKHGGIIYLLPEVKIRYFARGSFRKISKMFFQYGLFKPLVNKKIGRPATLRQFAPPLFTLFIVTFPLLGWVHPYFWVALFSGLLVYFMAGVFVSLSLIFRKSRRAGMFFPLIAAFPVIHLSYGLGYLAGTVRFLVLRRPIHPENMEISR